jgi:hypothetical protein
VIEALTCPQCHAEGYRALGAHGAGVRVACDLCGAVYVQPSAARLRERIDRYWALDEPSYHRATPERPDWAVRSDVPGPRSLWERLKNAWLGAVLGWRL